MCRGLLLWNRFCCCDVFLQRKQHVFGHSHGHTLGSVRGRLKQEKERGATPSFLHGKLAFRQAWLPCWRFCCGSWRFLSRNTYVSAASGTVAGCLGWADWLAGWSGWAGWLTCTHDVMTIALSLQCTIWMASEEFRKVEFRWTMAIAQTL